MSKNINFEPLFDYLDDKFGEVNGRLSFVEESQGTLLTSVSNLATMVKDFKGEQTVVNQRLENQEIWAKSVSKKVGIPIAK